MQMANRDTTYCKGENCKKKCWRHVSHWKFDKDKTYWFTLNCINKEVQNGRRDKTKMAR